MRLKQEVARRRRRGGVEDGDLELHAALAVRADAAEEPPASSRVERETVLAGGPNDGAGRLGARGEVWTAHLHQIVGWAPVLEHCVIQ